MSGRKNSLAIGAQTKSYATGGVVTYGTGFKIHTFSTIGAAGNFQVFGGNVSIDVLICGGGGATPEGGGGAGGYYYKPQTTLPIGIYPTIVGGVGQSSTACGITVPAGGSGGGNGGNGASGGGAGTWSNPYSSGWYSPGLGTPGWGYDGSPTGGGGGAGGPASGGSGGPGIINAITGNPVLYCAGDNYGGGGPSGYGCGNHQGVVIIRYPYAEPKIPLVGGTITYSGPYTIHTFATAGTFTLTVPGEIRYIDYLIVGGGGGGDSSSNVGGGAGGYHAASTTLFQGTYTITVGAGGAVVSDGGGSAISGIDSVSGGGAGVIGGGHNGGSGGGAGTWSATYSSGNYVPGSGIAGQGHDGGIYSGGGAGAVGGGSIGGVGLWNNITGTNLQYAHGGPTNYTVEAPGPGDGGYWNNGYGKPGVVIVRYLT